MWPPLGPYNSRFSRALGEQGQRKGGRGFRAVQRRPALAAASQPDKGAGGGGGPSFRASWRRGAVGARAGPHPAAREVALVSRPPPAPPPAPRPRPSDGLSRALPSRATELALTSSSAEHGRAALAATSAPGTGFVCPDRTQGTEAFARTPLSRTRSPGGVRAAVGDLAGARGFVALACPGPLTGALRGRARLGAHWREGLDLCRRRPRVPSSQPWNGHSLRLRRGPLAARSSGPG
ncbi:hypothetical protein MUG91_G51n34 [Manis pentadactyla]|nr:hypothetical protein MUG91_G51n34 [Manis pentadactyla]